MEGPLDLRGLTEDPAFEAQDEQHIISLARSKVSNFTTHLDKIDLKQTDDLSELTEHLSKVEELMIDAQSDIYDSRPRRVPDNLENELLTKKIDGILLEYYQEIENKYDAFHTEITKKISWIKALERPDKDKAKYLFILKDMLEEAVTLEQYEVAARLRDQILKLEAELAED